MLKPEVPLKDPCPCGSGRNYMNCCWKRLKRERAAARAAIGRVCTEVQETVYGEMRDKGSIVLKMITESLCEIGESKDVEALIDEHADFLATLTPDLVISDWRDGSGSPMDRFLADRSPDLHPAAEEFLRNWREANFSLYEVREVVVHSHLVLKDLLSNRVCTLEDPELSECFSRWETLFIKPVYAGGENHSTGSVLPLPRDYLEDVLQALESARDLPGSRSLSWKRFLKRDWWVIPQIWLELLALIDTAPAPEIINTDGERVESVRVTYCLRPGTGMMAAALLEKIPAVHTGDDGSLVWVEERDAGPMDNILLAQVARPDESTLVVSSNSRSREEKVCLAIEERLGDMIEDVDVEYGAFDPSEMGAPSGLTSEDLSPEELTDIKRRLARSIYADWPDDELTALDGLTPRRAVSNGRGRRRVIRLLKTIESRHEAAGDDIDFTWLWKELGLKRP